MIRVADNKDVERLIANESYDTTGIYDQQGLVQFAELMVNDETIPPNIKSMFWGFLDKETILSRSDNKDRRRAENRFAIIRNLYMMGKPQYRIDINELVEIQNAQQRNTIENNRSYGGFERQALTTNIKEIRVPKTQEKRDSGMFSGLMSKMGLGNKEGKHAG